MLLAFVIQAIPPAVLDARASADECISTQLGTAVLCDAEIVTVVEAIIGTATGGRWPPEGWVAYQVVVIGPNGSPCLTTSYHEPGIVLPEEVNQYDGGTLGNLTVPACPSQPGQQGEDPAVIAARYWEQIPLPRPAPAIAPGWAITGKLAYLETNGELRKIYTNSTPTGPLEIIATGTYHVNWGDGASTGPYSVEGRAWPNGEISHDYITEGTYDIVVTERWTATWRLAGRSGTLRELQTTGRIDDFPARQIQAVIR